MKTPQIIDPTSTASNSYGWVLALVLGFPLAMLVLGEAILALERRRSKAVSPLRILRNWVLPAMAFYILLVEVFDVSRQTVLAKVSETSLWISVVYAALTLLNVVLFEDAPLGSWQAKVPQLFRDLGRFLLVLLGSAIVLSTVWGADLGGLVTALGVGSLVLGLALQDSLGNIFSGLALLFEQPVALGDWIQLGDKIGVVQEVNWRSVHLRTPDHDIVVVPNSELGKGSFTNYSRPSPFHYENVVIGFSCDDPPSKVKRVLVQAALEVENVLEDPPPKVDIISYGDFAINYQITIPCPNYDAARSIRKDFHSRLWYAARRSKLTIPYPISGEYAYESAIPTAAQQLEFNQQALRRSVYFASLQPPMQEAILKDSEIQDYDKNELVLDRGERLQGLSLILEGQALLMLPDERGVAQTIGVLSAGDIFGEKASLLSDQTTDTIIRAADELRVLLLATPSLQLALEQSPRLGHELGEVMEIRRRAIQSLLAAK